jgi:hypothetical protein
MNTVKEQNESNVLVMFPASKNFPIEDFTLDNFPNFNDERFDNDEIELSTDETFDSLDAFMNRHKKMEFSSPDDQLVKKIEDQMQMISEAKAKIKYYLEEIELFLPNRR